MKFQHLLAGLSDTNREMNEQATIHLERANEHWYSSYSQKRERAKVPSISTPLALRL